MGGPIHRIAVVGLGACGILVCVQLIEELSHSNPRASRVNLHLFERAPEAVAGVAFGTPYYCHVLNMSVETLSVFPERPADFNEWLRREGMVVSGSAYLPRFLYGRYLRRCLDDVIQRATALGVEISLQHSEVSLCDETGDGVIIHAGGSRYIFDEVVLCLGDLESVTYQTFKGHPRYLHSPWSITRNSMNPDWRVGVLGSSLTAVDVLVLLRQFDHRGPLYCFSRRRVLPRVKGRSATYCLHHITMQNLSFLTHGHTRPIELAVAAQLFRREIEEALGVPVNWRSILHPRGETLLPVLQQDVEHAEDGHTVWFDVLEATSQLTPLIWHCLSDDDKATFMKNYYSLWCMHRHCMPLVNARQILAMASTGQLTVFNGLIDVSDDGQEDGFVVTCQTAQGVRDITLDCIINATGSGMDVTQCDDSLINYLAHSGQLAPHPMGGVDVDFDSLQLMRPDGSRSRRLYFLGPLTRGVHFYTNSIEVNRVNAEKIAGQLAGVIRRGDGS
jgi:uncharacterized NAD(P)/FAD-binding protein YdhS